MKLSNGDGNGEEERGSKQFNQSDFIQFII